MTSRPWVPVVVGAMQALTVVALLTWVFLGQLGPVDDRGRPVVDFADLAPGALTNLMALFPWWVVTLVLVVSSRLWPRAERVLLLVCPVLAAVLLGAAPVAGGLLAGVDGVVVASWVSLVLVLPLAAYAVWLVPRQGLRRARRLRA